MPWPTPMHIVAAPLTPGPRSCSWCTSVVAIRAPEIDELFGRCCTDADGGYEIHTRKPPPVATLDDTPQAPHLSVSVFARGLLNRVITRIYFDDETDANAADPTLAIVDPDRRHRPVAEPDAAASYRFDIPTPR